VEARSAQLGRRLPAATGSSQLTTPFFILSIKCLYKTNCKYKPRKIRLFFPYLRESGLNERRQSQERRQGPRSIRVSKSPPLGSLESCHFTYLDIFGYKLAVQSDLRLLRDADRSDGSPLRSGERVGFAAPFPLSTDPPVRGGSNYVKRQRQPIEVPCVSKVKAGAIYRTLHGCSDQDAP
jgi:hypothetical protein